MVDNSMFIKRVDYTLVQRMTYLYSNQYSYAQVVLPPPTEK